MTNHLPQEDKMHGSIFVFLKRFLESHYDHSTWLRVIEKAGIERTNYHMHELYPTREIFAILKTVSEATGISAYDLMEKFGEFLVPDLLLIYKNYVHPDWRTYEMLLHTEEAMHGAVRKEDNRTSPPILLVTKKGKSQLIIDYYSKRRMAGVAVGIIKGIARHYHEADLVHVSRLTKPDEERVQIQVDFALEAVPSEPQAGGI